MVHVVDHVLVVGMQQAAEFRLSEGLRRHWLCFGKREALSHRAHVRKLWLCVAQLEASVFFDSNIVGFSIVACRCACELRLGRLSLAVCFWLAPWHLVSAQLQDLLV